MGKKPSNLKQRPTRLEGGAEVAQRPSAGQRDADECNANQICSIQISPNLILAERDQGGSHCAERPRSDLAEFSGTKSPDYKPKAAPLHALYQNPGNLVPESLNDCARRGGIGGETEHQRGESLKIPVEKLLRLMIHR